MEACICKYYLPCTSTKLNIKNLCGGERQHITLLEVIIQKRIVVHIIQLTYDTVTQKKYEERQIHMKYKGQSS